MSRIEPLALTAAGLTSSIALYDAIHHGVTGGMSIFSEEAGTRWSLTLTGVVHAVTYLLLAAVLLTSAHRIDGGSRLRRWARRVLVTALSVLGVVFAFGATIGDFPGILAALAGTGFLVMFLTGLILGGSLVRRPGWRGRGWLLVAPLPLLGTGLALGAIASNWAHPGYAETAIYCGLALLGRERGRQRSQTDPSHSSSTPETVPFKSSGAVS